MKWHALWRIGILSLGLSSMAQVYTPHFVGAGMPYKALSINKDGLWAGYYEHPGEPRVAARATATNIVRLGTIGGASSQLNSIGDGKWAAGYSLDSNGVKRAVLQWDNYLEDLSFFQPKGYGQSEALGVSSGGHVTGWIETAAGVKRAFYYAAGHFNVLPEFEASSIGYDVDDIGTVTGTATTAAGKKKAFIFRQHQGVPEFIPTLGGSWNAAYAKGFFITVVGESETASGAVHAFMADFVGGMITDLGTLPGDQSSRALAINNGAMQIGGRPQVVGESVDAAGNRRAFLYTDETMFDLNTMIAPGQNLRFLSAIDVNDAGDILTEAIYAGLPINIILRLNPTNQQVAFDAKNVAVGSGASMKFVASGPKGSNYVVQASSDFRTWANVGATNKFNSFPTPWTIDRTGANGYLRLQIVP